MQTSLVESYFAKPRCGIPRVCSLVFIVITVLLSISEGVQEYPKVSILRWMTAESQDWEYDNLTSDSISIKENDKQTVYTLGQHLMAITVVCNASYPVKWTFHHYDRAGMYNIRIRTYRETAEDIFDVKSYKFSVTMDMYSDLNKLTGGYSCQNVAYPSIQNNVYIYAVGNSPPYLVSAGQTLTIKSEDNVTMILPCVVTSPDVQVDLLKLVDDAYVKEAASAYIKWDPQIGFEFNMWQMDNPFGNYKCVNSGGDDEEDYVFIHAVPGIESKRHIQDILEGNASYTYDKEKRQIKCCATGPRAPNLRNIYCEDPITCELREYYVLQSGNNGRKYKNSSCTVDRVYYRDSGVFRCKGDGIDIVKYFFSGYSRPGDNESAPLYFSWNDADPSKLLEVVQHYRPTSGKIYSNQTFYLTCDASTYYFSEGVHWALKWRNKTVQYLNESNSAYQGGYYRRSESLRTIKLVADMEMEELTCYAPVWNTSDWGKKTFPLEIYQSSPPTIVGPTVEEYSFTFNQTNQTIFCNAENAKPYPIIRWRKNNRVVLNDSNIIVKRSNGSSTITFKRVTHQIQGEYKCLVGNVAGRASKLVRVNIKLPISSGGWGAAGISITVIIVLALVGGMGFLVWKMKLQTKIINHLTGVVFRDMSTTTTTSNGQAMGS